MRRSLTYYLAIHVAVVLGAAVATATLTGSLIVGDSVRGSLCDLTLDRLGDTDDALVSDRMFREEIADDPSFRASYTSVAPAILLTGSARGGGGTTSDGRLASGVQIVGIDARFAAQYPSGDALAPVLVEASAGAFPAAVINEALRLELQVVIGDEVVLSFGQDGSVHPASLFASREATDARSRLRVVVAGVAPDAGPGRFALRPHQHAPKNAYVPLQALQQVLGRPGEVNLLLATRADGTTAPADLLAAAAAAMTLDDLGLRISKHRLALIVESDQLIIGDGAADAVLRAAASRDLITRGILTYVATEMTVRDRSSSYAMVAALGQWSADRERSSIGRDGNPGIVMHRWLATDLAAEVGDEVRMTYLTVAPDETLIPRDALFTVSHISGSTSRSYIRMTPTIPGLGDAENIGDWESPFPVDMSRVTPRDEEYWDEYGPTPKAFIALSDGQELWRNRFGALTSIVAVPPEGRVLADEEAAFRAAILSAIRPQDAGFAALALREDGLAAASGATDFSGLFVGFSMFLIAAAAMLTQLLFRLGVEQRAKEVGTLLAVGFPVAAVRRRLLAEGAVLAAAGATVGILIGVGYARLMVTGLTTLWVGAVGTSDLSLHVRSSSLALGWAISVTLVLSAIALTARRMGRVPARELLTGATEPSVARRGGRAMAIALAASLVGSGSLAFGLWVSAALSPALFYGSGAAGLVAGLAWFAVWLARGDRRRRRARRWLSLGIAGAARRPARSMLSVSLIACACFVIVSVGLNTQPPMSAEQARDAASGTGGFSLVAESSLPLRHDLNTSDGRFELGLSGASERLLADSDVMAFGVVPGEDASCLNLYSPAIPTLVGVTKGFTDRRAFTFSSAAGPTDDAWDLLHTDLGAGVVPMVADANSAQWILHVGLGDDLLTEDESGDELRLRLVGMLSTSVFQSVALISDDNLRAHFPSRVGSSFFLLDPAAGEEDTLSAALEADLAPYGFDATLTTTKLASFRAVENTYLQTFQALGGLGLLLGTVGLAVVLLRNVLERRGELATLRAIGFSRGVLIAMLTAENAFLALVGLVVGAVAALVAVLPALLSPHAGVPWASVAVTLLGVWVCALVASSLAAAYGLRAPLLPSLKAE
jgi:putative ABC transport system permease protein